jgi:hypothetical protein
MSVQLQQYMDAHNRQAEMIGNLKAELIMYRHFAVQAASAIEQLKHCLLRHYDAHSAFANDRAALLDADLVLAEAYKLTLGKWNDQSGERTEMVKEERNEAV